MVCRPPTPQRRDSIADSLTEGAELGAAYITEVVGERPWERFTPTHFIAAEIKVTGSTEVGLWALGGIGEGSIFAVNGPAREYSNWGTAMKPDSKIALSVSTWESYAEAGEALGCLEREN